MSKQTISRAVQGPSRGLLSESSTRNGGVGVQDPIVRDADALEPPRRVLRCPR